MLVEIKHIQDATSERIIGILRLLSSLYDLLQFFIKVSIYDIVNYKHKNMIL